VNGDVRTVLEHRSLGLGLGNKNSKAPAEAWSYQKAALKVFLQTVGNKQAPNCRLTSPTGSGKTLVVKRVSMGWAALGKVVIIAVPKRSIKSGFRGQAFTIDGKPQTWTTPMNFTKDYESVLRDRGEVDALIDFLKRPDADPHRRTWVCTHAALLAAFRNGADFGQAFVVIDEDHHVASEGADPGDKNTGGEFLLHMLVNGIPHFLATATPFRADRRSIIPKWALDKYKTYTRERADHIDGMRHVAGIQTRALAGDVATILDREFLAIKRERRKAIVSLPRVSSRFAADYGLQLGKDTKDAFEQHVIGIANKHRLTIRSIATPESYEANGDELDRILTEFREDPASWDTYAAIPDIVLVLERYKEGTDCAAWSTVIQIGLPASPVEILQFQGRGTRDHPCKDGTLVNHLCIIPAPDPKDETTFAHTLDTVKSLVVLGFMATHEFETMARESGDDSPPQKLDELLRAVELGSATPEQCRLIARVIGEVIPPGSESAMGNREPLDPPPYATDGAGGWSPAPQPLEPKPPVLLSRRLGLDVDAVSDESVLKVVRTLFSDMGKTIEKGFARKFQAHLTGRSHENRRQVIVDLYDDGRSLRQIVGDLRGRVTEDEIHKHLRSAGKLRTHDRYKVKPKVRRKAAPINSNILP
jgi:hypothetical protein